MNKIFPKIIDNNYYGSIIGLIIFFIINSVKFLMGLNISGLNPFINNAYILKKVDGIKLDDFPIEAANAVIESSASWALLLLIISIFGFLALFRYRAMIPLIFVIFLMENLGRKLLNFLSAKEILFLSPSFSMAAIINYSLIALLFIGLLFSIYNPFKSKQMNVY